MAITKKTTSSVVKEDTKLCIICGEKKSCKASGNKFYSHRNKFINDKFSICKECVETIGRVDDIEDIHLLMRLMDIPFIPEIYDGCTSTDNTLVTYVGNKGINIPKKKYNDKVLIEMKYADSPTCNQVTDVQAYVLATNGEKIENISKWGEGYTDNEYLKLNMSVENNIKVTSRDDYQSLRAFERVARAEIERDRAYSNQSLKPSDKKAAEDNVTNMMKQAGLSYDQVSRSASDTTLSEDIKSIIENYDPVPQAQGVFADPDKIGKYIDKFMTIPLLRSLGKNNSRTKDDFEEIKAEIKSRKLSHTNGGDD